MSGKSLVHPDFPGLFDEVSCFSCVKLRADLSSSDYYSEFDNSEGRILSVLVA